MLKPKSYLEYLEAVALSQLRTQDQTGDVRVTSPSAAEWLKDTVIAANDLKGEIHAQRTRRAAEKKPRFGVGTTFVPNGGRRILPEHTVVDIHTTTDRNGEVISVTYETEHWLMGQKVRTVGVRDTTIAIGLVTAVAPDDHKPVATVHGEPITAADILPVMQKQLVEINAILDRYGAPTTATLTTAQRLEALLRKVDPASL